MMKPTLADSWTYKTNYWLLAPPTDKTTFQWQLQYNWTQRMWLVFIKTIPHTLYQNVQNVQWQKVKTVKKKKKKDRYYYYEKTSLMPVHLNKQKKNR